MAFPPQHREPPPGLPSIKVPESSFRNHHHDSHNDMPFGAGSYAMPIANSKTQDYVPPPLPPPRYLPGLDGAPSESLEYMNKAKRSNGHSISSASGGSGYGSIGSPVRSERPNYKRRDTGDSIMQDDGYSSFATDRSRDSFPPEFGVVHNRLQPLHPSPADVHSDKMLRKLNPGRPSDRSPTSSLLTSSVNDLFARKHGSDRFAPTLNMPIHTRPSILDSPRMTETPTIQSAVSPRSAPFQYMSTENRSPIEGSDADRSPRIWRRNNSDDATSTHSYELNGADEMELDDAYTATGQKRRAASPAFEEHQGVTGLRRPEAGSRGSPQPRLTLGTHPSSISSYSTAASRNNSYISTASFAPSSATTASSFGCRSPGNSPENMSPTSTLCGSPYTTPMSLNPTPGTTMSTRAPVHSRNVSATSPKKEMRKPVSKLQAFRMCDCCPKKPKKFDTAEQLHLHEMEKQYKCNYCGNRFKNKNEAERHQNSLHVRRHSWSCSALSHYDRAFHDSASRPGLADTCGYCGDEFKRNGRVPGNATARQATDKDWEERIKHLQEMHKFRECNSSKRFFRADHFRQHLKHSHAGTSGKWTNMLENACMVEEDPTPR